jgi:hypothetical protein
MYTHITNSRITDLKNTPSREQIRTVVKTGKPAGLWYAYGDEWKAHFYNKNNSKKAMWKYTLNLHDDDFTDTYDHPAPTKILKVNKDNFVGVVAKYGKDFIKSNTDILEDLVYRRQADGDGTLDFLLGEDEINCDSNNNNNNNTNIKNLPKNLKELSNDIYSLICEYINIDDIPSESLDLLFEEINKRHRDDKLPYKTFDWAEFWNKLSEHFAGIEFAEDLLGVKEIASPAPEIRESAVSTEFIPLLEIRSGVIFKPATFFADRKADWIEEEIKNGGRRIRRTRKHTYHHRKTKKLRRCYKK